MQRRDFLSLVVAGGAASLTAPASPSLFAASPVVVLAWGNARQIAETEKNALEKVSQLTDKSFLVRGRDNIICHPSPQMHSFKLKWLDDIYAQLKTGK